jgi:hypothetical protein
MAIFILFIELTIRYNHIRGMNELGSTGQLLPLVVGGSGLVKVVYKMIFRMCMGDYRMSLPHPISFLTSPYLPVSGFLICDN